MKKPLFANVIESGAAGGEERAVAENSDPFATMKSSRHPTLTKPPVMETTNQTMKNSQSPKTSLRQATRRILTGSIAAACAAALLGGTAAQAATLFWDGAGGDVNWSTLNNWGTSGANITTDPLAIPGSADDVVFYSTGATQLTTNLIDQAFTLQSLTFGNTQTGAVTIGGGSVLTLNGKASYNPSTLSSGTASGITAGINTGIYVQSGSGATTISAPITLGAAQQWVNNASNTLLIQTGALTNGANNLTIGGSGNTTISSTFTGGGAGGVTKVGAGTLTLNGSAANTFTGGVTVNAGTFTASYANFNGNQLLSSSNALNLGGLTGIHFNALIPFA